MDPNETLRQLRDAVKEIEYVPGGVVELVEALDEWLTKGGFLPDAWAGSFGPPTGTRR